MGTLLVVLSHPDDEITCAGTIAAHAARGDRVVVLWLTRGTMTEAFAKLSEEEVARVRTGHGEEAARLLGAEPRFLDFPDTAVQVTPEAAHEVARVLADVRPDALITWGEAWNRGMRHPDHQATGRIARDAVTFARIGRIVSPLPPHREPVPIFTLRDAHSTLPVAAVDVSAQLERIVELGRFYHAQLGWPEEDWLRGRLSRTGADWRVDAAELFEAWERPPGLRRYLF